MPKSIDTLNTEPTIDELDTQTETLWDQVVEQFLMIAQPAE